MGHRIGEIKPIDVGLFDPGLQLIGDRLWTADHQRPEAANPRPVRQLLHGPLAVRIGSGKRLHHRLNRIGMQILQHLVRLILAKVDPGPAGEQRQRPFVADVRFILLPFSLGFTVGFADDDRLHIEDQDAARIAPGFLGATANIRHRLFQQYLRRRADKYALRVAGGELLAAAGGARLIEHRRTLRRRLTKVDPRYREEVPLMVDRMNFSRIAEDLALPVAQHRAVFPAAFQQFIDHLQVFIGVVVAGVMVGLRFLPNVPRPALQIGSHDIPAHPPLRQMVEGRKTAGERIGMLKGERSGQAESQMLRHQRHRRNQRQRIVDRHLRRLADRRIAVAVQHIINAQHIGDKYPVKLAALQQTRQVDPILEIFILPGAVARMGPQPRRLMADAVHIKSVQTNFTL